MSSRWRDPNKINLIVIHCSASPNGKWVGARTIDEWHGKRGFERSEQFRQRQNHDLAHIGYHFVIYTNGGIQSGRHIEETGAHVLGQNQLSIGVCLVGTDAYSPRQWEILASNIRGLQKRFPLARVTGHRDLSPDINGDGLVERWEWLKTCPGFDVAAWLKADMAPPAGHVLDNFDATDPAIQPVRANA